MSTLFKKPPILYRIIFKLANWCGYEVSISRNAPFMKDKKTIIYIGKRHS